MVDAFKFNPQLHGLRALAALGVIIFHWAQFFPIHPQLHAHTEIFGLLWHGSLFIGFGWMGVPLFFVLSGYLLTAQLLHRPFTKEELSRFWRRRILRIYPAVWLQILLLIIISPFVLGLPSFAWSANTVSNFFLYVNLPPNFATPVNGVWWTLPVELSFYLLLPGLVWLERRGVSWGVITSIAFVVALIWRVGVVALDDGHDLGRHQFVLDALPGSLAYFCAGFAAAHIHFSLTPALRYVCLFIVCLMLYLALLLLAFNLDTYWQGGWMLVCWPVAVAPLVAACVWLLLEPLSGFKFLGSSVLVWIGQLSFGLYLWHYPVLSAINAYWPSSWVGGWYSLAGLIACLLVSLLLAQISFRYVERRIMGW